MFIIANDADGYGIDRCLASGEKCGTAAANAYCKTQAFAQATTFHKVDRGDITGALRVAARTVAMTITATWSRSSARADPRFRLALQGRPHFPIALGGPDDGPFNAARLVISA